MRKLLALVMIFVMSCASLPARPPDSLAARVAQVRDSVGQLDLPGGSCSTFHVGWGQFLTAAHCVADFPLGLLPDTQIVMENGAKLPVELVKISEEQDLALLKTHFFGPELDLDCQDAAPGDGIFSIGYPFFSGKEKYFSIGYVVQYLLDDKAKLLITNEAVYQGYSGGAMISLHTGKVVAVVSALIENVKLLRPGSIIHQHATVGIGVPTSEILEFLGKTSCDQL